MKDRHKIILQILAAIATFYLLYLIVSVFIYNDYLNSLIPGWHKTVYTLDASLRITILVGFAALFTYILFKLILKFLTYLWLKTYPSK